MPYISEKNIIAEEIQNKCQMLFSDEYTSYVIEMEKTQKELDEITKKQKALTTKLNEMKDKLS